MGWSPEVRTEALIRSARHCCVCHRYKGLKLEVHHIIQPNDGGSDTIENAIVLCFDCHSDAGHYNPKHPRGNKFSLDELRKARDAWWQMVVERKIPDEEAQSLIHCRYLVCKSFDIMRKVAYKHTDEIRIERVLLHDNFVLQYQRGLFTRFNPMGRFVQVNGREFSTLEEYRSTYPEARITYHSNMAIHENETSDRRPTMTELRDAVGPYDALSLLLLEMNVPLEEIALAYGYWEHCPDTRYREYYILRDMWSVYLAITNIASSLIKIESMSGVVQRETTTYRSFQVGSDASQQSYSLPRCEIPSGWTVIVPLALVIPPLRGMTGTLLSREDTFTDRAYYQVLDHWSYPDDLQASFRIIGPSIHPSMLQVGWEGQTTDLPIHDLDLTNLYAIDTGWNCGSCPFLFFRQTNGLYYWGGEIISQRSGIPCVSRFVAPPNTKAFVIAELEDETTYLTRVTVGDETVLENLILTRGQRVELASMPGQVVTVHGFYVAAFADRHFKPMLLDKEKAVLNYLFAAATELRSVPASTAEVSSLAPDPRVVLP